MPPYKPPPVPTGSGNKKQNFQTWAKKHGINAAVAADIQRYAAAYGINPYYFGAVLLAESGAQHLGKDGKLKNSGQAVGISQLSTAVYLDGKHRIPWGDHHIITMADLQDYNTNLRLGAAHLARDITNYGYAGAYLRGYNPSDPNRGKAWKQIQSYLPKGIIPGGATGPAAADATTINTGTETMRAYRQLYDPIYYSYTGRPATNAQIRQLIRNPVSTYELTNRLSDPKKNPHFYNSPIWQTNYPSYEEIWKNIYGPDSTPDRNAVRYAIVHNLGASFAQRLRDRPDYNTSQEYKGLASQYGTQYSAIYGTPDQTATGKIDMAIRKGWNADQWKQFLRAQPEWQGSGEFQKLALGLTNALGFDPELGAQQTVLGGQ